MTLDLPSATICAKVESYSPCIRLLHQPRLADFSVLHTFHLIDVKYLQVKRERLVDPQSELDWRLATISVLQENTTLLSEALVSPHQRNPPVSHTVVPTRCGEYS